MKYHLLVEILYISFGLLFLNPCDINGENEIRDSLLHCGKVSHIQKVRRTGDNIYVASQLDSVTDIVYWFKKCMFNELFTFYKVYLTEHRSNLLHAESFNSSSKLMNWSHSDNIGPFDISEGGWCGGNHSYKNNKTAECISYRTVVDGIELRADTIAWGNGVEIKTANYIFNPLSVVDKAGTIIFGDTLCKEFVNYKIQGNSIEVCVRHEYTNGTPVVISKYYGMQSMFADETDVLTMNGLYHDWHPISLVSRFKKKTFRIFDVL